MMSGKPAMLQDAVDEIKKRVGRAPLSREDILVLACKEIARSVSYEEKHYNAGESCEKS